MKLSKSCNLKRKFKNLDGQKLILKKWRNLAVNTMRENVKFSPHAAKSGSTVDFVIMINIKALRNLDAKSRQWIEKL